MSNYTVPGRTTEYAGVFFRSQLEARWAVFFDVVGITWEHEPEKFPGYIPDFRLPQFHCYLEVKPRDYLTDVDNDPRKLRAWTKAKDLAKYTLKPVMLMAGEPRRRNGVVLRTQGVTKLDSATQFGICRFCNQAMPTWYATESVCQTWSSAVSHEVQLFHSRLLAGYLLARDTKFERGNLKVDLE